MVMLNMMLATGLWGSIVEFFVSFTKNYAIAIILLTVALKLILSPLDYYQRVTMAKTQKAQALMQPELTKINEKYKNDRDKLNAETLKLQKKYGITMKSMCLPLLLTLGISTVIFLTLFNSLTKISNSQLVNQYDTLKSEYEVAVEEGIEFNSQVSLTEEELQIKVNEYISNNLSDENLKASVDEYVKNKVLTKYSNIKKEYRFLWINNVLKKDSNTYQLISFDNYANLKNISDENLENERTIFNNITGIVYSVDGNTTNGYYIMIVIVVLITILQQFISTKLMNKTTDVKMPTNKVLMIIMPLIMFIFAIQSTALFSIYIVINSIMTTLISFIIGKITNRGKGSGNSDEIIIKPKKSTKVVEYSRNYKPGA